jgi:hypothetical protein
MYMYNFALGIAIAKARNVRRKDVFLDGLIASMVKSPAVGLVLVSALSPNQTRGVRTLPSISGITPGGPVKENSQITISGTNLGPLGGKVVVTFQYVSVDGTVSESKSVASQTVAGLAGAAGPIIQVNVPAMDTLEDPAAIGVTVTVGAFTSSPQIISFTG